MTNGGGGGSLPPAQQALAAELQRAGELFNQGRVREALDLAFQVIQTAREWAGDRHPFVADLLVHTANMVVLSGEPMQAEPMLLEALELRRAAFGELHKAVADALNQLAILYTVLRRWDDSERSYRSCLDIIRQMGGERQPAYADGLRNLGALFEMRGDDAGAEALYEQALEILRETLGPGDPDVAKHLQTLARMAARRGAFQQAEGRYREALDILRAAAGERHPVVADALTELEALYRTAGDTARAEELFEQAMAIRREALGPRHPDVGASLFDLATYHATNAEHSAAERLLVEALDIWREAYGDRHPNVARALRNLAGVYWSTGDYARGEGLEKEALAIEREAFGDRHPAVADDLNALAATYEKTGALADAERVHLEALDIRREALGDRDAAVAESLNNLAVVYLNMGRLDEAARMSEEALDIRREVSGDRSQDAAFSMGTLGVIARYQGDYERAEALARGALDIARQVGDRHPHVLHCLNDLAFVCVATGRIPEALDLLTQIGDIHDGYMRQVFATGSEKRRQAWLSRIETSLHSYLSLVRIYLSGEGDAVRSAFDLVLRRKGIGGEAVAAEREAVLTGRYPEQAARLRELALLRMEIAQAGLAGPGPEGRANHERRLEDLAARKEALEQDLASALPEVDLERRLRGADRRAVSQVLPPGSTLVEVIQCQDVEFLEIPTGPTRPEPRRRYLAFVLPASRPEEVGMVDLGEAEPIDELIAAYRAEVTGEGSTRGAHDEDPPFDRPAGVGHRLREAVFDPLVPHLDGHTRLFLAPDGDLTRLPYEVLPTEDGARIVDDYTLSYLSTGRDALRFGAAAGGAASGALVAAAPDFDLGGGPDGERPSVPRSRDLDAGAIHFGPLLGTAEEGRGIGRLLGVSPWLGDAVRESRLKAAPSPMILHLATHGFFLPNQVASLGDRGRVDGPLQGVAMENPLLRSGLALAGANTFLRGGALPPDAEDGIITAEDVSGLDLLGTELVVLSACETGLGEVRVGEGVFGLRRAFVLAGARTLIMSLWKVPDAQSSQLMQRFYRNLADGLPRAEALRAAQLEVAAEYPHPWFWGAFICQGDPGPLAGIGAPTAGGRG